MKNARLALLILATTLSHATAALAQTETTDAGKSEYDSHCSICHGDAKGNGVFGDSLKAVPPDLTLLARNNRGVFPADRVSRVIDGRVEIASHGPRDMPVWGRRYAAEAAQHFVDFPYAQETYIRARVLRLVEYLNRIQQK